MVTLLAKLFIRDHENVTDSGVRQAYGMLCGIVGIFFNLILFTTKALAGFFQSFHRHHGGCIQQPVGCSILHHYAGRLQNGGTEAGL